MEVTEIQREKITLEMNRSLSSRQGGCVPGRRKALLGLKSYIIFRIMINGSMWIKHRIASNSQWKE